MQKKRIAKLRFETACIVSKGNNPEIDKVAINIAKILKANKIEPSLVEPLRDSSFDSIDSPASVSKRSIDLIVVVGGDGTILKTVRNIKDSIPVLGINMGGRGTLAEVDLRHADKDIKSMVQGKYFLDARMRIVARIGRKILPPALNEIYIDRLTKLRAPTYTISIDGESPIVQRMDGIMVSTPTGSTGHSLSMGSSTVYGNMEALLITPIAPIARMPSIVVPPWPINVESTDNSSVLVDGQLDFPVRTGNKIRISRHSEDMYFVRFAKVPFRQLKRLGY